MLCRHTQCLLDLAGRNISTELFCLYKREVKRKCKVHLRTGHEGPEGEERYSSILSLTSALDGCGGGQGQAPAASPLPVTLYV
jgi:hypothetical protein